MDRSEFDRFRHIHKDPKQDRNPDKKRQIPTSSAIAIPNATPITEPFFARSAFPAPRFWLTKVVSAMDMLMIGRKAIPSSFAKAPVRRLQKLRRY